MATPAPSPLDAAIAKLRSEGRTDKEIAEILRNPSASSPQPSQPTGAGVQGPMTPMTGVLGNVTAVLSHATGKFPALTADLANVRNSTAPVKSRRISALKLVGAAVVIVALGYAIYQEWQIHIVNNPALTAQQVREAEAKACVARVDSIQRLLTGEQQHAAWAQLEKECFGVLDPHDAAIVAQKPPPAPLPPTVEVYRRAFHALQTQAEVAAEDKLNGIGDEHKEHAWVSVAWAGLFAREFSASLDASERAVKLKPDDLTPLAKQAHALMFLERTAEAKAIYLAHKGGQTQGTQWKEMILDDFTKLKAAGVTHPMMDEIQAAL